MQAIAKERCVYIRLLPFWLLMLCAQPTYSSDAPRIDSLRSALKSASTKAEAFELTFELSQSFVHSSMDSSLRYAAQAIALSQSMTPETQMRAYSRGSRMAKVRGDFDLGIQYSQHGLTLAVQERDTVRRIRFYQQLGGLYHYLSDYDKAMHYFSLGKSWLRHHHNPRSEMQFDANIAHIYRLTGRPHKALELYMSVVNRGNRLGKIQCSMYGDIGKTYTQLERYEEAIAYHLQHIDCSGEYFPQRQNSFSSAYIDLADAYLLNGESAKALTIAKEGMELARSFGNYLHMREHAENLAEAHAAQNRFDLAYAYHQMFARLKDSILNEASAKTIAELEIRYETERKEHELTEARQMLHIQALERKHQWRVTTLSAGLIILLCLILALVIQLRSHRIRNKNIELGKRLLRAQMNPHFLFNTLMAMKSFLYRGDVVAMDHYLFRLATHVRSTLEGTRLEYISLEKERQNWHDYLELQQLRLQGRFDFSIHLEPDVNAPSWLLPPMLVQPLLENAVKHGLRKTIPGKQGDIQVQVSREGSWTSIIVEDNGKGLETEKVKQGVRHRSMGTQIILDRLAFINGRRKGKATLQLETITVDDVVRGTRAILRLPLVHVSNLQTQPAL